MEQAGAVVDFLEWLIGQDGQAIAQSVNYAPLPVNLQEAAGNILGTITFEGNPVK